MNQTQVVIVKEQGNGFGLAGLIFSILGWLTCGFLSPVGALLSFIGLFSKGSKATAIAGLIVGFPGVLFFAVFGLGFLLALLGIGAAAVETADKAMSKNQKIVPPPSTPLEESAPNEKDAIPDDDSDTKLPPDPPVALPKKYLDASDVIAVGDNKIAIEKVVIGKAKLMDKVRKSPTQSEDVCLSVYFKITNESERKALTFRPKTTFGSPLATIVDDVGNVVRRVDFGFLVDVVDGSEDFYDIAPKSSLTYVSVFTNPLPETQFLIATVRTDAIGKADSFEIKIPRNLYDPTYKSPEQIAEESKKAEQKRQAELKKQQDDEAARIAEEKRKEEAAAEEAMKAQKVEQERLAKEAAEREEAERIRKSITGGDYREWSSKDGKFKVKAALQKINATTVTILRLDNDKKIDVPIDKLSESDQKYIDRFR